MVLIEDIVRNTFQRQRKKAMNMIVNITSFRSKKHIQTMFLELVSIECNGSYLVYPPSPTVYESCSVNKKLFTEDLGIVSQFDYPRSPTKGKEVMLLIW